MTKAILTGMPKMRIVGCKEAGENRPGKDGLGGKQYLIKEESPVDVLEVSGSVRDEQIARLKEIKAKSLLRFKSPKR